MVVRLLPRRTDPVSQPDRFRTIENTVMTALAWLRLVPNTYVLTTRGRRTGKVRRNPVTVVRIGERKWLVAPYGTVSWVHNALATGRIRLSRVAYRGELRIEQTPFDRTGPVLKRYVEIAPAARPYFAATRASSELDFVAEAAEHPVFELIRDPATS